VKQLDVIEFCDAMVLMYEANEAKAANDRVRLLQLAADRMTKAVKMGPVTDVMLQIATIFKVTYIFT
jgi:hypothetical protein